MSAVSRHNVCHINLSINFEILIQIFIFSDERQWRELAYCLSLLNYSDRSIQKLNENLLCFADKLCYDFIYDCINTILINVRKATNIKNDAKQIIDEFEQKVKECRNKGMNDDRDDSEFQKIVGTPPTGSARKSMTRIASRLKSANKRDVPSAAKKGRNTKKKPIPRKKLSEESESEEDMSSQRTTTTERTERPSRNVKRNRQIIDSESEESDE